MNRFRLHKLFISYVIPTVLAMFISAAYQIVDGVFIGNFVGGDGLAAANIGWSCITLLLGLGFMTGIGVGSHYSIAIGQGDKERALGILGQTLFIIVVFGSISGSLLYLSAPFLAGIPKANDEATRMGIEFVSVFAISAPFVIGSLAMPFIVRNVATPIRATVYMSIGVTINILFSYLLIIKFEQAVFGAAIASVIGETVAMCLASYYLIKTNYLDFKLRYLIPRLDYLIDIIVNGASALFMYVYVGFMVFIHHIVLEEHGGTSAISAYTVTGYLLTIYYFSIEGVANGIQPLLSKLYGLKCTRIMSSMIRMTIVVGIGLGIIFTLALQLFPHFFASLFIGDIDELLLAETTHAIRLNLSVLFLEGVFVIGTVFFQSIGEGQKAFYIAIGNLLIQIPFLIFLPKFLGLNGVWLTMPIASIVLLIPTSWMMYKQYQMIQ